MYPDGSKAKRKRVQVIDDADQGPRRRSVPVGRWLVQGLLVLSRYLIAAPLRWAWRQSAKLLRLSWKGTVAVARWSWKAVIWSARLPFRFLRWTWRAIALFLWGGPEPEEPLAALKWRIQRRFRRRNRFITHLFAFALILGAGWLSWFSRPFYPPYDPTWGTPLGAAIVWSVFLAFHYVRLRSGDAEDHAIEAALERHQHMPFMVEDEVVYDDRYARLVDEREWPEQMTGEAEKRKRKRG